jgi:putative Mg2+ transporter-C (MgtC) family protein
MSKHLLGEAGAETSRVITGIITGVGFLGAGALIHEGSGVHGLTTAASIWLVASVGIACGVGLYMLAAFVTLLALLVLVGLSPLTKTIKKRVQQRGANSSGYHRRSTDEE